MGASFSYMYTVIGILIGLAGSFFGGLFGVGGAIITIPLMIWLAKATQHEAHGTSLFAIFFIALAGSGTYFFQGNADWRAALAIAASAIFTARIGALFAHSLPQRKLKRAFGCFLIFASATLVLKTYLPGSGFNLSTWSTIIVYLLIGSLTGFLSGMMGVGGGGVMIPLMVILGNMEQHLAQGTSLLAMIPISLSGAMTHYRLGNVRMNIAWGLAIGSLIGSSLGAMGASLLPEFYLRVLFAALGFWMGARSLRS
jgi:uncharacterized membrane protein YfcA